MLPIYYVYVYTLHIIDTHIYIIDNLFLRVRASTFRLIPQWIIFGERNCNAIFIRVEWIWSYSQINNLLAKWSSTNNIIGNILILIWSYSQINLLANNTYYVMLASTYVSTLMNNIMQCYIIAIPFSENDSLWDEKKCGGANS